MKFIHLSDLHLGKRVNEFFMIEDRAYILNQIAGIIETEQPQGVFIAGDVYDKPIRLQTPFSSCSTIEKNCRGKLF